MSTALHDAYTALEAAGTGVQQAVDDAACATDDPALIAVLRRHQVLRARLDCAESDLIATVDLRDVAKRCGASSTAVLLTSMLLLAPAEANRKVRLARAMESVCPGTYNALYAGEINTDQACAIAGIVTDLPEGASEAQTAHAERYLLDHAGANNALQLRQLRKRVDDVIDPDRLLDREATAVRRRDLNIRDNHDGTQTLRWTDTDETIATAKAALGALAAPRPAPDGTRDPREPGQRRADAMRDLVARSLRFGDLPTTRGMAPNLIVTIDANSLLTGTGFGTTTTGELLTAQAVQRLACDANLHPLHIDEHGRPLRLGRARRIATNDQWLALIARDGGCIGPRCTRPAEWTRVHHVEWWENHGVTDIDVLCLLCDHCHDLVHHHGWDIVTDEHGRHVFIPPPEVDLNQKPVRNDHWRTQRTGTAA